MKKIIIALGLILLLLIYTLISNVIRHQPRVVFCDVGQGDAIYFRLPEQTDVLVDTGPTNQVLNCLNREIPYFDRQIELVLITHWEKDHMGGLTALSQSFKLDRIYLPITAKSKTRTSHQDFNFLAQGDKITIGHSVFRVLSPSETTTTNNPNESALALWASVDSRQLLLLSDLDAYLSERLLEGLNLHIDIFKLPHHGSKYGLSHKLLELAHPHLAVLSVGKHNFYGHPHQETLRLLQSLNIPLKRTDKEGDVEIRL